jgi:hypothetical protein
MVFLSLLALAFGFVQQVDSQPPSLPNATQSVLHPETNLSKKLLGAKRIFVEHFGDDPINKTLEAMVIDALTASKRFTVTEKKQRADLLLKGYSLEKTTQEAHAVADSTVVAGAAGGHSASVSGVSGPAGGSVSGVSSGGLVAHRLGISDSQASVETVNDARMAVRLVSTDGDVVWSTTQESKGAKYKGAMADVAEKAVKQLLYDIEKLTRPVTK